MSTGPTVSTTIREWILSDIHGMEYRLSAECEDALSFAARLKDANGRIAGGVAWRNYPAGQVQLEDLYLERVAGRLGFRRELGRVLRRQPRQNGYRGLGLGTLLLQIAVTAAREAGAKRLYGFLSEDHLQETPDVAAWLWHRGFVVTAPPAGAPLGTTNLFYMDLN